jgi:hypothetical protein
MGNTASYSIDTIGMARSTGINIFIIYDALKPLGVPYDPVSQDLRDRWIKADLANDEETLCQVSEELLAHADNMGRNEELETYEVYGTKNPAEGEITLGIFGKELSPEQMRSLFLARERIRTGVPWETAPQCEQIRDQAVNLNSLEEMLDLYGQIPAGAEKERSSVLQIMAICFFKK